MKREETEGPTRPTSSPGGVEGATEGERDVEVGNCGVDAGGRARSPAEDQGVACEGPGAQTILQGLGQSDGGWGGVGMGAED